LFLFLVLNPPAVGERHSLGHSPRGICFQYNLSMNIADYNRSAWDHEVENGNCWTIPVTPEQVAAARTGQFQLLLTPTIPVPMSWFGEFRGKELLLLASGGGQQGPLLAAAGANVTVFDNSPRQLARDREVAARENLEIRTVQGDMRDLSHFADASFDLIFHPVSNCFIDDVRPVWREAFRVLRKGGALLAGFNNPIIYSFDQEQVRNGVYTLKHKLPYSDLETYTMEEHDRLFGAQSPLEWGHSLNDQIGGQLEAGFLLAGFYEDIDPGDGVSAFMSSYIATRAVKI
jgi:SAM-dependent methyltransferase